ncbi:transcriptional regulator, LysR family [Thermoanaerobacter mathranii subsp. mathranii str. A3]|uniref:Transcriptional regulator, LysR family n=1 Tax=Thermoanaerobacter mathranii subsp. mathranii (strain DSM 11426 / CCUG 53645 / CIP 108742 / A3) TaxID=583358 RepID=A0ABN3YZR7_THEM3|nr:selenium metabolism-associated LysR family transcriptional regulator [Thermoanaerobacter mathranii]ADH60173.1 transcriptional regulator, LysR family [Thermoanaerobacter mathranii subsp. mathranii str. A3]
MTLRDIEIFVTVCELKSMSAAAKKLYMSQPAISQAISQMEGELQVRLFDRIGRKLSLTYAGEILYSYGKRILNLVKEAESTLDDVRNMRMGRLRVGTSTTVGIYLLPEIIGEFRKKFNIDVYFTIGNTAEIEKLILDNSIDLGIVEGPVHSRDIVVTPYIDDELYLVCSKSHRWAKKKNISPAEIENEDIIMREKGSGTREVFEEAMARNNVKYRIKYVLNNTEAIKKAVEANIGVSVISRLAVKKEIRGGRLLKVDIENIRFKRKFSIIYHKDKFKSNLFEEFIKHLYNCSIR